MRGSSRLEGNASMTRVAVMTLIPDRSGDETLMKRTRVRLSLSLSDYR